MHFDLALRFLDFSVRLSGVILELMQGSALRKLIGVNQHLLQEDSLLKEGVENFFLGLHCLRFCSFINRGVFGLGFEEGLLVDF